MPKSISKFFAILSLTIFFLIVINNIFPWNLNNNLGFVSAQENPLNIKNQGQKVLINNKTTNLPWIEWQEENQTHIAVSDTGIEAILGIELLNTNNIDQQPIHWFNYYETLSAKFVNPYRYIDLTNLTKITPLNLVINDDVLNINLSPAQVNKVYEIRELKGKKIVIELDNPTFFQVSQGKDQGFVRLESNINQSILEQFKPIEPERLPIIEENEGDKVTGAENQEKEKPLFIVTEDNEQTLITINLPPAHNLRVDSAKPNLLLIELKPDAVMEKEIKWSNEIEWRKKYISLNSNFGTNKNSLFLVNYLTLNLAKNNLDILPVTTNENTVVGTAPLKQTAENLQAIAAINGGFFNRKNQMPLGVIKNRENWLSGPILKRGVIAWDEVGKIKMGRLELQEVITVNNSDRFISNFINSGYVEKGISRYTPSWGISYTTMSDNETIIIVENDIIQEKIVTEKAGENEIAIPNNGYLLVLRKEEYLPEKFGINQKISVSTLTIPADFIQYPYIMGAGPLLLLNRQIVLDGEAENFSKAFNEQKASRSAIAVNNEGKLMLVAVHNRVGGAGPSLLELCQILQNMGAIDALNLDGGSSTQIYLGGQIIDRSPATASRINNGIGIFLRKRF